MPRARAGEVELEYEVLGDGVPLLLIGGLGSQLTSWDDEFCLALVDHGYKVIRFDNRDSGLSTGFDQHGVPDLLGLIVGEASPPYLLDDMAGDAAGLLAHLGIERARVLGLSLGGMIGQLLALEHPDLVISVVAALSGPPGRPSAMPAPEVVRALVRPPAESIDERIEAAVNLRRVLAAGGNGFDEALARKRAAAQIRRAHRPAGTMRQAAAVLGTPNRAGELGRMRVPTMFVHGDADPLIPFASAAAAAAATPDSTFFAVPGLGHDLPPKVAFDLVDRMIAFDAGSG